MLLSLPNALLTLPLSGKTRSIANKHHRTFELLYHPGYLKFTVLYSPFATLFSYPNKSGVTPIAAAIVSSWPASSGQEICFQGRRLFQLQSEKGSWPTRNAARNFFKSRVEKTYPFWTKSYLIWKAVGGK